MRLRRISALVLAAVATTMLTGCPWDKEEEPGSSSSSSSSSSSRPDYDDDDEDDGRPDKPDKPEEPDEPEEPDAPDITLGEGATIVSQTYDKESNSFTVVFSVASKDGYKITSVTVAIDGTAHTLTPGEDGNYTFSLPAGAESCTVNVTYEDLGYTLSEDGSTYEVSSAKGLLAWAQDSSKNCTLTQDIDLTGTSWNPVSAFSGEFDGQGYTISGLTQPIFATIGADGKVRNLNLDVNIVNTDITGGIAGGNNGTIENCTVSGTIQSELSEYTGGIAGINASSIKGCIVSADVKGGRGNAAGGIAGLTTGAQITACCFVDGNVEGEYIGGIAGAVAGGTVTACYWSGSPEQAAGGGQGEIVSGEKSLLWAAMASRSLCKRAALNRLPPSC